MSRRSSTAPELSENQADAVGRLTERSLDTAVADFLRRHPDLAPLLQELRQEVDKIFDAWTPVELEVVTDPEEGDSALFARIRTDVPLDDALQRLDALLDGWGVHTLPKARGLLHLDVRGA